MEKAQLEFANFDKTKRRKKKKRKPKAGKGQRNTGLRKRLPE